MKKAIAVLLLLAPLANAGVVRYSAKHGYKGGKFAGKQVYKAAKYVAKKAF